MQMKRSRPPRASSDVARPSHPGSHVLSSRTSRRSRQQGRGRHPVQHPSGVLDQALLEPDTPAMTPVLSPTGSLADARRLIDPASSTARRFPDVPGYHVDSVLVHGLRFTVSAAKTRGPCGGHRTRGDPLGRAGSYTTTLGGHRLEGFCGVRSSGPGAPAGGQAQVGCRSSLRRGWGRHDGVRGASGRRGHSDGATTPGMGVMTCTTRADQG
jgi:hypothetical protein